MKFRFEFVRTETKIRKSNNEISVGVRTFTETNIQELNRNIVILKPRLHEQFFARAGDAIFFKFCRIASAQ